MPQFIGNITVRSTVRILEGYLTACISVIPTSTKKEVPAPLDIALTQFLLTISQSVILPSIAHTSLSSYNCIFTVIKMATIYNLQLLKSKPCWDFVKCTSLISKSINERIPGYVCNESHHWPSASIAPLPDRSSSNFTMNTKWLRKHCTKHESIFELFFSIKKLPTYTNHVKFSTVFKYILQHFNNRVIAALIKQFESAYFNFNGNVFLSTRNIAWQILPCMLLYVGSYAHMWEQCIYLKSEKSVAINSHLAVNAVNSTAHFEGPAPTIFLTRTPNT